MSYKWVVGDAGIESQVIQRFILPSMDISADEKMYVNCNCHTYSSREKQEVAFFPGGAASFDTFFNGLTVERWKQDCKLETLSLELDGVGRFQVRIGLHRLGHATRWLRETSVELELNHMMCLELDEWQALEAGILFVELRALGEATFAGARWVTQDRVRRGVDLGVVVTHFNRKQAVVPAIRRIKEQVNANLGVSGSISLVVVDNSRNLEPSETEGATVIPNPNLGGSGGFTRGLMHLQDEEFSHCLFMDDDASCEIESIRRAHTYMSYVCGESVALAGSLLREIEPYRLFEKGAQFDGVCRPLKSGLDMRKVSGLLEAECNDYKADYGGWWFFAFTIADVKHLAFPFFVRGDDIMFSMQNCFDIKTMNGVACWGEDFGLKSGPLPIYLDVRNHLVQQITHMDKGVIAASRMVAKFFLSAAMSYNYATAHAVTQALLDVLKGPEFWRDNLDTSEVRRKIGGLSPNEKMLPIDRAEYMVEYRSCEEGALRKLLRGGTLNGFLLPSIFLKNAAVFQHKSFRGSFREVFGYKRIVYEYVPYGLGYVAEHDKPRFFSESLFFAKTLCRFVRQFSSLKRDYQDQLDEMTSQSFWHDVYASQTNNVERGRA